MVKTASLFSQLLDQFPRHEFAKLVKKHGAERNAKGFTCWTQFVSMLFCQAARTDSLREICNGLACCLGKLAHLGVSEAPNKSTLSYANGHRPAEFFEDVFWTALKRFRSQGHLGAFSDGRSQSATGLFLQAHRPDGGGHRPGPRSHSLRRVSLYSSLSRIIIGGNLTALLRGFRHIEQESPRRYDLDGSAFDIDLFLLIARHDYPSLGAELCHRFAKGDGLSVSCLQLGE